MSDFFHDDFFDPAVEFSLLPATEGELSYQASPGQPTVSRLWRTTAGMAMAGALWLVSPSMSSDLTFRHSTRLQQNHVDVDAANVRQRGAHVVSPANGTISDKALRAGAFLELVRTREPKVPDPDYGF